MPTGAQPEQLNAMRKLMEFAIPIDNLRQAIAGPEKTTVITAPGGAAARS